MDFNRFSVFNARLPHDELYGLVTSAGVRTGDPQNGVLMYFNAPGWRNHFQFQDQITEQRIARIRAAGGVIIHDSGDTIMAEWDGEKVEPREGVSKAVRCAFRILNECDQGNRDKIKIVISAGMYTRARVGDEDRRIHVVFGPAGYEIRSIVPQIDPGLVVLSRGAWQLCDRENIIVEQTEFEEAVTVHGIIQQQGAAEEDPINYIFPWRTPPRRLYLITHMERERFIHGFMMQASLEGLDEMWQPQRELQEAWPVSVMFVNVHYARDPADLEHTCNIAAHIVAQQMFSCNGEICGAFIFNEGCVFVCAVGLPETRRHDRPIHALLAAHRIHYMCCRRIDCLLAVSVGVTTGRICYTVEEQPDRNKYTLHGLDVVLAGSLTKDYPGTVSSDVETKLYSMLPLPLLMPRAIRNQYHVPFHQAEINELLADEAALSRGMDGGRLALAHLQTMKPDERKVVKYAAAIGHTFGIEMLRTILQDMAEEVLATTITTLFRVGIFECAFKPRNVASPNTCYCENDPEVCQLMSFCNHDEMEMVHKLMEKDMSLFHEINMRCVAYLEERRYRCSKCDTAHFAFAQKVDWINRDPVHENDGGDEDEDERLHELYKTIRPNKIFQSQGFSCWRNQTNPAEESSNDTETFLANVKSMVTEARDSSEESSCECARLVETVLVPRAKHWRCAGSVYNTFCNLLESASAYVHLQNDAKALEFLTEARAIMDNLKDDLPAFPTANRTRFKLDDLERAFVYRLTGEILFRAGKITEAERNFREALKILKCSLPRGPLSKSVKLIYEKMKKLHFGSRQRRVEEYERRNLARLQECIGCLSFLWQIGYMRGQPKTASLAITMEINLAIQSGSPFEILYAAIDHLKYSQLEGKESKCRDLEAFLCRTCTGLSDHPEGRRLIGHLTRTLAFVKLCTGDLDQSIEFTTQAQELSQVLNEPRLDARTTAALQLPLLLTGRFDESAQQIKALEDLSEEMSSTVAKGWFYVSCMNFLLYAGFVIRPFEECLAFVEESQTDANLNADKSLLLQLYSSVALWFAWLENWEKFKVYYNKAHEVYAQVPTTVESIAGAVILLECSVLLFRNKPSTQRRTRTLKLFSDIARQFGAEHILAPRALHLKAYVKQLTGSRTPPQKLIEEALLLCEKQGNRLEKNWIEQSQDDWSDSCGDIPAE